MDKEYVVWNGILLGHKKEWKLVTCDDMNGLGNISEISQGKTNTVWFHLYVQSKNQNKWT